MSQSEAAPSRRGRAWGRITKVDPSSGPPVTTRVGCVASDVVGSVTGSVLGGPELSENAGVYAGIQAQAGSACQRRRSHARPALETN